MSLPPSSSSPFKWLSVRHRHTHKLRTHLTPLLSLSVHLSSSTLSINLLSSSHPHGCLLPSPSFYAPLTSMLSQHVIPSVSALLVCVKTFPHHPINLTATERAGVMCEISSRCILIINLTHDQLFRGVRQIA